MDTITIILGALLTQGSLIMTWFTGACFPCHLLGVLKRLGYRKNDSLFWKDPDCDLNRPPSEWLRHEWEFWAAEKLVLDFKVFKFPLGTLLICPVCLSWHLALWTSVLTFVITGCSIVTASLILLISPYISNVLLNKVR